MLISRHISQHMSWKFPGQLQRQIHIQHMAVIKPGPGPLRARLGPGKFFCQAPCSFHHDSFYPKGGRSSENMKHKGRLPAPPPWPEVVPTSSLSPSFPRPQGMGRHRASQRQSKVTSSAVYSWATQRSNWPGQLVSEGLSHVIWQWVGGSAHNLPSYPLLHWAAPMVKPVLLSSPGLDPLQTMGTGYLYQLPLHLVIPDQGMTRDKGNDTKVLLI